MAQRYMKAARNESASLKAPNPKAKPVKVSRSQDPTTLKNDNLSHLTAAHINALVEEPRGVPEKTPEASACDEIPRSSPEITSEEASDPLPPLGVSARPRPLALARRDAEATVNT